MSAISALCKKTWYSARNFPVLLLAQPFIKIVFVVIFVMLFEVGLFLLFIDGFSFLQRETGIGTLIINHLFSLFFLVIGLMLIVSAIIVSYSTMFKSDEIPFLLTRPFEISHIVIYKFLQSTFLSSWAFFFTVLPFVGAYAWHERMGLLFAVWTFLFSIPFLMLCAGIGTIFLMLLLRCGPRIRPRYVPAIITVILIFTVVWFVVGKVKSVETHGVLNLSVLLPGLNIASNPLLPSRWFSEGILSLATFDWQRGSKYWLILASTSWVICIILEWLGTKIFVDTWQRSEAGSVYKDLPARAYRRIASLLYFLPSDLRAMVSKDVACFVRNPVQWSQVLIFFGLLAVYFSNIRSFNYHLWPEKWRNIIACMNIFSVSAVVCSLASRFIYPQLSLEGQGFWIIGLAPTTPTRIVLAKFALAFISLLPVSAGLMLLSSIMLDVSSSMRITSLIVACAISSAVSAMSTGLGAVFLDLKQRNPMAIVSGFGGTLNLVLNLAFMLITIIPFAFIFYHYTMRHFSKASFKYLMIVASAGLILVTAIVTFVPLWIGIRSLKRREF